MQYSPKSNYLGIGIQHFRMRLLIFLLIFFVLGISTRTFGQNIHAEEEEILIRRTQYGVPHIKASTLYGVAFGLAFCELEDYGDRVIQPLVSARGDLALFEGYSAIEGDFINQLGYDRAVETYHLQDKNTRDMLEGFAQGVNYFLDTYPLKFPQYTGWTFTGYDVAALATSVATPHRGRRFVDRLKRQKEIRDSIAAMNGEGSNVWALSPNRTTSGKAILMRNPHLSWEAGYYEAHLTVPGKLNFYGDFRIGGVFAIIGGFSPHLGWSTTNNNPDLDEIYALNADPLHADHYLIDGGSFPLTRKMMTAEFKNGDAIAKENREFLFTPYGPVIHRDHGKIYVLKTAGDGEFRRGEQFVHMMLSRNLAEWKDAMRMQAIVASNYTYADADGNIFYVWNATIPDLPMLSGGDSIAVTVNSTSQIWTKSIPFDALPQLLNPPGGYLHNENDPFHFANLNSILSPDDYPPYFPEPRLRQRSQHSIQILDNDRQFSLEDVVKAKHSMRALVADQMKPDLIRIMRASKPKKDIQKALDLLDRWDNTVSATSRGSYLFEQWFRKYVQKMGNQERYKIPWSFEDPMHTPTGIANPDTAITAFFEALNEVSKKYGTVDMSWGEINRLRHGDLDLPVGGGPGGLGCFRVLYFTEDADGKRRIQGGDGWVFAVEFSDPPRAYTILAYGQSNDPASPHHTDQATMFAKNQMKKVAFTEADIQKSLIKEYWLEGRN
jgi:acyl-homoserine-lactone acylase